MVEVVDRGSSPGAYTDRAPASLRDIVFDCADQQAVARFWAALLGYTVRAVADDAPPDEPIAILPPAGTGIRIWFNRVPEPKVVKNRVHVDINLSDDLDIDQLKRLGARPLREVRAHDGTLYWTIMADIEGNEFCAFPPPHRPAF